MLDLLAILGALTAAGAGVGTFIYPVGLKFGLESMINLKQSGFVYPLYMSPPVRLKSSYYIYEVQNPR